MTFFSLLFRANELKTRGVKLLYEALQQYEKRLRKFIKKRSELIIIEKEIIPIEIGSRDEVS